MNTLNTITINAPTPYPVHIACGLLSSTLLINTCDAIAPNWVIITDNHINPLYAKPLAKRLQAHGLKTMILSVPAGEQSKTRKIKAELEDQMLAKGFHKETGIIALGGGMITDLAGFIAATYLRGIACITIPLSLLGMVDASIGGKTAVNTPFGKNLIGCFSDPAAVFIDPDVLKTLAPSHLSQGFAEMIKHALIADKAYFEQLNQHFSQLNAANTSILVKMIRQSILIKQAIVEADPLESGRRQVLNFGHTIAHALELTSNHTISHGDAVAIGLMLESHLSCQQGWLAPESLDIIFQTLKRFKLPTQLPLNITLSDLISAMQHDKKNRQGNVHFVHLAQIGRYATKQGQYSFGVDPLLLQTITQT